MSLCGEITSSGFPCKRKGKCPIHKKEGILSLPPGILIHIFSFVSYRECVFASEVCRKFFHNSRYRIEKEAEKGNASLQKRLRQIKNYEFFSEHQQVSHISLFSLQKEKKMRYYKTVEKGVCDESMLFLICELEDSELFSSFLNLPISKNRRDVVAKFADIMFALRGNFPMEKEARKLLRKYKI